MSLSIRLCNLDIIFPDEVERNLSFADMLNKVLQGNLPHLLSSILVSPVPIQLATCSYQTNDMHDMLVNVLISKGFKAFGFLLMIGMKGVLLLSILSLNFSCGR